MIISMSELYLDEEEVYHCDDHYDREEVEVEELHCCHNGCMDCLGLSWRDFI